jgi:hypothetical protein
MTLRQRRIIGVLVIANAVVLVMLLILVRRSPLYPCLSNATSPLALPSPVPQYRAQTDFPPTCQRRAVQLLSLVGLGGKVTLADQTIRFDLVYRVTQNEHADDVAQQVWTAFDVAQELANGECDAFSRVEVVIEAQGTLRPARVYAAVDAADIKAFHSGELGERAFIDRVQYRIEPFDGS